LGCRVSSLAAFVTLVAVGCGLLQEQPVHKGGYLPASAPLVGDLDGDGRPERVQVYATQEDPCDLALVTQGSMRSANFSVDCVKPSEVEGAPPFVEVLAPIDRVPGLEVVVQTSHGASHEFARLFTVRHAGLVPVEVDGQPDRLTIVYYGSAGTGSTSIDCAARKGFVVSSYQSFRDDTITRTRYRMVGTTLVRLSSKRLYVGAGADPAFRELRGPQPFPSCAVARR
jgi:hypothetical protein